MVLTGIQYVIIGIVRTSVKTLCDGGCVDHVATTQTARYVRVDGL